MWLQSPLLSASDQSSKRNREEPCPLEPIGTILVEIGKSPTPQSSQLLLVNIILLHILTASIAVTGGETPVQHIVSVLQLIDKMKSEIIGFSLHSKFAL